MVSVAKFLSLMLAVVASACIPKGQNGLTMRETEYAAQRAGEAAENAALPDLTTSQLVRYLRRNDGSFLAPTEAVVSEAEQDESSGVLVSARLEFGRLKHGAIALIDINTVERIPVLCRYDRDPPAVLEAECGDDEDCYYALGGLMFLAQKEAKMEARVAMGKMESSFILVMRETLPDGEGCWTEKRWAAFSIPRYVLIQSLPGNKRVAVVLTFDVPIRDFSAPDVREGMELILEEISVRE